MRQVLEELEKTNAKGETFFFDIEYRMFNSNNKTGGSYKKIRAKLLKAKKLKGKVFNPYEHAFRNIRDRRNPNHWDNVTRNFELEKTGLIRKIKIRYITRINGVEVAY